MTGPYLEPDAHALLRAIQPTEAERTETALARLLAAIEENSGAGPSDSIYRTVLRRHGESLAALLGPKGLVAASNRLSASARPGQAEERRALLAEAWAGLDGVAT